MYIPNSEKGKQFAFLLDKKLKHGESKHNFKRVT